MTRRIHLGDLGRASLYCHVVATTKRPADDANWTWSSNKATCKRCLAAWTKELKENE